MHKRAPKKFDGCIIFITGQNTNAIPPKPFMKFRFPILKDHSNKALIRVKAISLTFTSETGQTMRTFWTVGNGPAYGFCPRSNI